MKIELETKLEINDLILVKKNEDELVFNRVNGFAILDKDKLFYLNENFDVIKEEQIIWNNKNNDYNQLIDILKENGYNYFKRVNWNEIVFIKNSKYQIYHCHFINENKLIDYERRSIDQLKDYLY